MGASCVTERDPLGLPPHREEAMDLGDRAGRTDDDTRIKREGGFERSNDLISFDHVAFFGVLKNDSTWSWLTATPAVDSASSSI